MADEFGNSTVWDDSFANDREALDEAFRTIEEDGIDSLIGPSPDGQRGSPLDHALTLAEFNELDYFLADVANEDTSMDAATLDGFLTAIAISPQMVRPSEWLPWVWDSEDGQAEPGFEDEELEPSASWRWSCATTIR